MGPVSRFAAASTALLLLVTCSPAADDVTTSSPPLSPSNTTGVTPPVPTVTSASEVSTTTSTLVGSSPTLPGEVVEIGPQAGDRLMVVGVAHDDVLNLRVAPGPTQQIIDTIEPTFQDLIALGETRQIPGALWIRVEFTGNVGWVHMSFIGYEGKTDDLTSVVVETLGENPEATTMTELGRRVAGALASADPKSDIVLVIAETGGDVGEVTYDVIGLGDDAVLGLRVHVFGQPTAGGFSLTMVEATLICGRGVGSDGVCP